MKQLLVEIKKQHEYLKNIKINIVAEFASYSATQIIDKKIQLGTAQSVLTKLQEIAFNIATPAEIAGIVKSNTLHEGINSWSCFEITPEVAFGKPYCSAEEWYKNAKLQALYPNKYRKDI